MIVKSMEVGALGTNCYIVYADNDDKNPASDAGGGKKAVVIDPGDDAGKIIRALEELNLTPCAILLTHGHFDHIGAVDGLTEQYKDLKVFAARSEDALLNDANLNCSALVRSPQTVHADRLLDDGERFGQAGIDFEVIATPGHTEGSVCFYVADEKVMFSGDTLFYRSMGRTDLPTGNPAKIRTSLARLAGLADEIIVYPGHGPATSIGDEKRENPYMAGK